MNLAKKEKQKLLLIIINSFLIVGEGMKYQKNQYGFTLIELAVGMALMSIVMAGVLTVLMSAVSSYNYNQERIFEVQEARKVFNELIGNIQNASSIKLPDKGGESPSIIYVLKGVEYTVMLGMGEKGGYLLRNNEKLTADILRSVNFYRDKSDGRLMTITIMLNTTDAGSANDYRLSTTVFSPNLQP